ncbi:maleylpyruvate isomerase family mycothiol-dependent enzyme [Nesterenkonia haasae]|uniref:maleylpyruvate isomerase family mycothiol-dependent enzyme n=1 Tax=Nesterenkonia haasae TaxID=2587813 RepID=UPI001F182B4F|nr:maleylpyruvate isomerase family mycothiol-dependent enzyme [Nesterenkonia haasae]NDK30946.1 maleylpyruvate isomerase family mycothiol-dependent enzyme [Nesterenkonia haasae]
MFSLREKDLPHITGNAQRVELYARDVICPTGRPWIDELAAATEQFAAVLVSAERNSAVLASPVQACPGWDLRDLAVHLGRTHRWTVGILEGADPRQRPQNQPEPEHLLSEWYAAEAETLRKELALAGPDAACWTLVEDQRTALFWQRRQVHETLIHLWDARHALGQRLQMDPALSFDGVAEVRDVMYPRMVRAERVAPLQKNLAFSATDLDAEPIVIGDAEQTVEVHGPAPELLLLVWHRVPWRPTYGDHDAAELITQSLVP